MKLRRNVLELSQLDLAEMSEVSLATIKDMERGKANPSLATMNKVLDVLGMEIDFRIRKSN